MNETAHRAHERGIRPARRLLAVLALASLLAGCATLERGTSDRLSILSEPAAAKATTSLGSSCTTPCSLEVSRRDAFSVTIEKPGYAAQTVQVTTQISSAGAGFFMENVITGGVGVGVDVATGAVLEHVPNPVSVKLVAKPALVAAASKPRPVR